MGYLTQASPTSSVVKSGPYASDQAQEGITEVVVGGDGAHMALQKIANPRNEV